MFLFCMGIVSLVSIIYLVRLIFYAEFLWRNAKPKRRKEWVTIMMVFGNWYTSTGISVPRALDPMFDRFSRRYMGLKFSASQVIVFDESGRVYVGVRNTGGWLVDIGAAGICSAGETLSTCAKNELHQEMGLIPGINCSYMKSIKVLCPGPYQLSCILGLYIVTVPDGTILKSVDNTYKKIFTVNDIGKFLQVNDITPTADLPFTKLDTYSIMRYLQLNGFLNDNHSYM